jgi:ribose transport system ATP-binding protein
VDLAVDAGACVGLVRHNGAGKSTLMHASAGGLAPDHGQVVVGGGEPRPGHAGVLAPQLGIRRAFKGLSACPDLTVAQNAAPVLARGPGRPFSKAEAPFAWSPDPVNPRLSN